MQQIIVTCYTTPDLDGFASAIAYGEFLNKTGKKAEAMIFGGSMEEVNFVMRKFGFNRPLAGNADPPPLQEREIVLVDASDLNGLPDGLDPKNVIEVIDHRKINEAEIFKNAKIQIEFVGAAATLIAEKFIKKNVDISKMAVILLYSAIASNTLNFQANVTSKRDIMAADWLKSKVNLPSCYIKEMFTAKSDFEGNKLESALKNDCAYLLNLGGKKIKIAQLEMIEAKKMIQTRKNEIFDFLRAEHDENRLDYIFLMISDVEKRCNFFIAEHKRTQNLLKEVLGVKFEDGIAVRKGLIMRKEIVPMLKKTMENKKLEIRLVA